MDLPRDFARLAASDDIAEQQIAPSSALPSKKMDTFKLAFFRWPDGGLTVLFARGEHMVEVQAADPARFDHKVATRHGAARFDGMADACPLLGAEEIEPHPLALQAAAEMDPQMKNPARRLMALLSFTLSSQLGA